MTISACSSSLLSLLEISRTWNSFGCLCVRGRRRSYLPARTLHFGYIVFFRSRLCSACVLVCLVMTFLRAKIAGQYDVHDPLKSRAMVSITASCTTTRLIVTFLDVKETRESCLLRISILREWSSASPQSANIQSFGRNSLYSYIAYARWKCHSYVFMFVSVIKDRNLNLVKKYRDIWIRYIKIYQ